VGDLGVNGSTMLILNPKEIGCECVDRIQLAQDRIHWQELVNMTTCLRVP
jgi:hypothetical protein